MNTTLGQVPALRRDISVSEGAETQSGAPSWVIYDPLQHRYFQIGRSTYMILKVWQPGLSFAQMADKASKAAKTRVPAEKIEALAAFLREKALTDEAATGQARRLAAQAELQRKQRFSKIASKALFFRVPVWQPEKRLKALLPFVAPLYSRTAAFVITALTLCGLFLVSQRWGEFIDTFHDFFSLEGIAAFALTLFFMKAMHELGHAFTAMRYGCRVPSMGVAFMMLTPMLYTDVTDAWQLKSRRQRVAISAAGVVVELALAGIATFLWAFLEDGTARAIAFTVATSGWLTSLLINLNPLMRYDGYYVLSDLLGVENLQQRANAFGAWRLRRLFVAPDAPPPEYLPDGRQGLLIGYAWASWVYRLIVFFGIAFVVDRFSVRAVGFALFVIGTWFLVLRPVIREVAQWRKIDTDLISRRRIAGLGLAALIGLGAFFLPVWSRVEVPAVLLASDLTKVLPTQPARIVAVNARQNATVRQGDPLVELDVPALNSALEGSRVERDLIAQRLAQATANAADRAQTLVLKKQWEALETRIAGLTKQREELSLRAPFSGLVLQTALNLHPGRWVGRDDILMLLSSGTSVTVRGYVQGLDAARIAVASRGTFVPDDLTVPAFGVELNTIASVSAKAIDTAELASVSGGRIAVKPDESGALVPVSAQYAVTLDPVGLTRTPGQVVRGVVVLDGTPESLALRWWHQISKVLALESGL